MLANLNEGYFVDIFIYLAKLCYNSNMVANFDFLKKVDKDLYEIIDEAEHLYRDEYFDQCMTQTRRFGENVCKNVLGDKRTVEDTFDEMLATLKDNGSGEVQEKEFIDDLYFLKKHGNDAVHSSRVNRSGMDALECLQRAFEVAINYSVYNKGAKDSILNLRYDTELLVTGKKSKKSLAEKYKEEKENKEFEPVTKPKKTKSTGNKKSKKSKKEITLFPVGWGKTKPDKQNKKENKKHFSKKQTYTMAPSKRKNTISPFWIIVGIFSFISLIAIMAIFLITIL